MYPLSSHASACAPNWCLHHLSALYSQHAPRLSANEECGEKERRGRKTTPPHAPRATGGIARFGRVLRFFNYVRTAINEIVGDALSGFIYERIGKGRSGNRKWIIDNGKWKKENRKWKMENGN